MVSLLASTGCRAQQAYKFTDDKSVLEFYKQYSSFTDPGEYEYLYENRWMLVDPSMDMVDFSTNKFIFSNDA